MPQILADIGGTHVRYGLLENGKITSCCKIPVAPFENAVALFEHIAKEIPSGENIDLAISAAGSMHNDSIWRIGNNAHWEINPEALKSKNFNLSLLVNDFKASARGIAELTNEQKIILQKGTAIKAMPLAICGPGTGLGLAYLTMHEDGTYQVNETEGGHMNAVTQTREQKIIADLVTRFHDRGSSISYEDLISGRGLPFLYQAIAATHGYYDNKQNAIDWDSLSGTIIGRDFLRLFHEFFGSFVQSVIFYGNATGGVYLDGGVIQTIYERGLYDPENFNKALLHISHPRLKKKLAEIPLYLVNTPYIALHGLKGFLHS